MKKIAKGLAILVASFAFVYIIGCSPPMTEEERQQRLENQHYIYIDKSLPRSLLEQNMLPKNFIFVEDWGNHWYVYRNDRGYFLTKNGDIIFLGKD